MTIPVIRGRLPETREKEFKEFQHYDSGRADEEAIKLTGDVEEPWLEIIRTHEPSMFPATERLLADAGLMARIKGSVIDVGAGTCFLTGKLSQLTAVEHVYAIDLSETFLKTIGTRILKHVGALTEKITFVATDFNHIPLLAASADTAFIFAAIHHSLSPIKTLQEVGRVVKPGGTIIIMENPKAVTKIRSARRESLALSTETTEICYTIGEFEYLIACANIGPCEVIRWDVLSRPGPRRWIRTVVRALGLEHVILNPPNYLFVISRKGD